MNVNKKLGRFKQWAGEKMGGEAKICSSIDFQSLEVEMGLRQDGMDRLHKSMAAYVKHISKRIDSEDKAKPMPVSFLGSTLVSHGEDFEDDSEFGTCMQKLGRTNERIGDFQEAYVSEATSTWLESIEKSLAQMKDYQAARKKLESRRLAYDAALAKMSRAKHSDPKVEEEYRSAKIKHEDSTNDVHQRMEVIKEAEVSHTADLGGFLDAELRYHDRCRDALLELKREWPNRAGKSSRQSSRQYEYEDEPISPMGARPVLRSTRIASNASSTSTRHELNRPIVHRATTFEGPRQIQRAESPFETSPLNRIASDSATIKVDKDRFRAHNHETGYCLSDPSDESNLYDSPSRSFCDRSASPTISLGSTRSNTPALASTPNGSLAKKRAPPPPPPSRATKPPPPPLPVKRSTLGTNATSYG